MLTYLDFLSVIICLTFLVYGSWSDLKTREVSNGVWIVSLPIVTVLTVIRIYFTLGQIIPYAISALISIALPFLIFEIGFFGGADAKAMITLGIAIPLFPSTFHPLLGYFHPFFPLTVLMNSFLLSLLSVAYAVVRNALWKLQTGRSLFDGFEQESVLRKLIVLLTGYKVGFSELERKTYLIPIEDAVEEGEAIRRGFRVFVGADEDRNVVLDRLKRYVSRDLVSGQVWVTPGLPMMVFITLAFVTTLVIGDLLFHVVGIMFRITHEIDYGTLIQLIRQL